MKRMIVWVGITSGILGILALSTFNIMTKNNDAPNASISGNPAFRLRGTPGLEFESEDVNALSSQCSELENTQQYNEALVACERAIAFQPNSKNLELLTSRSNALFKLKRYYEAVASYNQVLKIEPNNSLALTNKCQALSAIGKQKDALASCNQALQVNQNWGNASPEIANKNKLVAQLKKSGKTKEPIIAEKPPGNNLNDAINLKQQGMLYQKLKQYDKALNAYNRAIAINPKYSQVLALRCETLNKLQKYHIALASCNSAFEGDRNWGELNQAFVWQQRSSALLGLQKYEPALTNAEQALALKPDYAEAWNNKGVSLWNLRKYQEAEVAAKRATNINPRYVQGWFNYGRILSSLNRYQEAVTAYDKALSNDVNSVDRQVLASIWANKGAALWHLQNYQSALNSTNEAIKINPESFEGWYNKGVVLLNVKDYNQALIAYNKANSISPNNANVLNGIGMALVGNGEYKKGLTAFEKALKIDPNNTVAIQQRATLVKNIN